MVGVKFQENDMEIRTIQLKRHSENVPLNPRENFTAVFTLKPIVVVPDGVVDDEVLGVARSRSQSCTMNVREGSSGLYLYVYIYY